MTDFETLEHAHGDALERLETLLGCDRYAHPSDSDPDGSSTWICQHCDMEVTDLDEGAWTTPRPALRRMGTSTDHNPHELLSTA